MVAQYLLPDKNITFEQLAKLADWKKGYAVWGFPARKWLMDQGVHMTDYDVIDYAAWAKDGVEGLRKSVSGKEFNYYEKATYDLGLESKRVNLMYNHPNFTYIRRKPTWSDVVSEFRKPGACDLTLDSRVLNRENGSGLKLHRVVILDITSDEVVFNDPNSAGDGVGRREPLKHFRSAFEKAPELARYYLEN